eukprot:scaffold133718_cov31-Tisochrysis_lutea.AAC.2
MRTAQRADAPRKWRLQQQVRRVSQLRTKTQKPAALKQKEEGEGVPMYANDRDRRDSVLAYDYGDQAVLWLYLGAIATLSGMGGYNVDG